jgi:hypothetical protein
MLWHQSATITAITGLMLLTAVNLAPSIACPPVTVNKSASSTPADKAAFLIVPNKSVGKITKQTNRSQLAAIFGKSNVTDFIDSGPEGQFKIPASRVTIGGKHSLNVLWKDADRQKLSSIEIIDSRWYTADGMTVNAGVAPLQRKFGKFSFLGFGWDYGGSIDRGNTKLDKYRETTGISFKMDVSDHNRRQFPQDWRAVSGDQSFSSDNPRMLKLKAHISVLYVRL